MLTTANNCFINITNLKGRRMIMKEINNGIKWIEGFETNNLLA